MPAHHHEERWVGIRQIRDTGSALEMLDRAYWGLNSSMPDIDGARWNLREAVSLLDRASYGSRWAGQPQTPFASPLVA